MKTHEADIAFFGIKAIESAGRADILSFPLLYRLIKSAMPELLNNSPQSRTLLRSILGFVFESKSPSSARLKNQINKELYTSICGLKSMLRKTGNINVLTLAVDEHKRRFASHLADD